MVAGLLSGPAIAASAATHNSASSHGSAVPAAAGPQRLPLSAGQMLADRRLHENSAASGPPNTSTVKTGAITGSAQAADGQPLDGVCVVAYGPSGRSVAATRPDGRFLLTGLKPGAYQVRYVGCGNTSQYLSQWYGSADQRNKARSVAVSASALQPLTPVTMRTAASESPTADVIDLASQAAAARSLRTALGLPAYGNAAGNVAAATATSGGRISGVVRDAAGHGLSGICAIAESETGAAGSFVHTGKDGRYETGRLPAGSYVVLFYAECGNTGNWVGQVYNNASFLKPTLVNIHRGKTTSGIDATLRLGGEISGTVTNSSGAKLSGICVEPVGSGKTFAAILVSSFSQRGTYHLRGLPAGPYKINFIPCDTSAAYAEVWWPHAATEQAAKTIRLKQREVLGHVNEVIPVGGVISGTVTNSSNAPLAGICVFAAPGANSVNYGGQIFTTNANGQYKIIGLSPGGYTIQFQTGCGNNGNYLGANYPDVVTVTYGQTKSGVNVEMPTGGIVSGTVTSAATGKPVRGICVSLTATSPTSAYYNPGATTGAAGTYKFNQIPTGTYYVQFSGGCGNPGSYSPQSYDNASAFVPQPITVTAGQTITDVDAAMQPGASIAGTVKAQGGRGLSGICVYANGPDAYSEGAGTSRDGRYTVANLLPGQYQVSFFTGCGNNGDLAGVSFGSQSNPPLISVPVGTTSGIDAVLPTAGNISGQILTRSGRHVNACVTVIANSLLDSDQSFLVGETLYAGHYDATNLAPGAYVVNFDPSCDFASAYASQWYKDRPTLTGTAPVRVRAGHTVTGISSALVKGGSITGRVTAAGKPVNGVCVFGQSPGDFIDFGFATTNKAGKYDMTSLNGGRYELEFEPCDEGAATLADTLLPRLVTVRVPHVTTGANAVMPLGGDITGTVLGGSPAIAQPNVCAEADEINGFGGSLAITGANGEFTITNLPAGKYQVDIGDCGVGSNLAPQWYEDAPTAAHATVVPVSSGKATALTSVTLSTNGAITGTVTGPGHTALAGVCVTASSLLLAQPVVAVSGASGAYTLLGLPPSAYRIQFSSECGASGYRTQWWDARKSAATATVVKVTAATSTTGIDATMEK